MFPSVLGGNLGKSARVFIKFCRAIRAVRPIPLGVFRGKRKKREEKKDIMRELCKFMENYLNLFALVSAIKSPFLVYAIHRTEDADQVQCEYN